MAEDTGSLINVWIHTEVNEECAEVVGFNPSESVAALKRRWIEQEAPGLRSSQASLWLEKTGAGAPTEEEVERALRLDPRA